MSSFAGARSSIVPVGTAKDYEISQTEVFRRWANSHLSPGRPDRVTNLLEDLKDGKLLLILLGQLSKEELVFDCCI